MPEAECPEGRRHRGDDILHASTSIVAHGVNLALLLTSSPSSRAARVLAHNAEPRPELLVRVQATVSRPEKKVLSCATSRCPTSLTLFSFVI